MSDVLTAGTAEPDGSSVERRYRAVLEQTPRFKVLTGASNEWFGQQIGVDASCVTRFLGARPGYEPHPRRRKMMRILVGLEGIVGRPDPVLRGDAAEFAGRDESDVHQAFCDSLWRDRYQRTSERVTEVLADLRDAVLAAMLFPCPYRACMCANVLLTMGTLLERAIGQATPAGAVHSRLHVGPAIVRLTLRRAESVEQTGLGDLGDDRPTGSLPGFRISRAKLTCYCGFTTVMGGLCLTDGEVVRAGLRRLCAAAELPCEAEAGIWGNTLTAYDAALARLPDLAGAELARLRDLAENHGDESLSRALDRKPLAVLKAHWLDWKRHRKHIGRDFS